MFSVDTQWSPCDRFKNSNTSTRSTRGIHGEHGGRLFRVKAKGPCGLQQTAKFLAPRAVGLIAVHKIKAICWRYANHCDFVPKTTGSPHGFPQGAWIQELQPAPFYGVDTPKALKVVHFRPHSPHTATKLTLSNPPAPRPWAPAADRLPLPPSSDPGFSGIKTPSP